MSYYDKNDPWWIHCVFIVIFGGIILAVIFWDEDARQQANTPPTAATVAIVSTCSVEATSHYVVETITTSHELRDAQVALTTWLAAHPDLRIVEVIPLTEVLHGNGGTHGLIIVAEVRSQ